VNDHGTERAGAEGAGAEGAGAERAGAEGAGVEGAGADDFALDGNAIGGLLIEVFGTEMTTAVGTCGSCGAVSLVAELAVYMPGPGTVVRCRSCGAVLMAFVRMHGVTCVDLQGLASLS
jgi:hypothetical protein